MLIPDPLSMHEHFSVVDIQDPESSHDDAKALSEPARAAVASCSAPKVENYLKTELH